jgi:hypothetical protein
VQADDAPAILALLNRGDTVDVVGEFDEEHYVIKIESGYGLVEKQLLRLPGEPAYEVWTGYAHADAEVCSNYQLTGEAVETLKLNTQVEVLDELKHCYVVKVGETAGFILKSQLSKNWIQYSGGGDSGGADGGDISLQFGGIVTLSAIPQTGDVTGTAEVLADGAQVILGFFNRTEMAPVVSEEGFAPDWNGYYTLYLNGMYAYLPQNLAQLESDAAYESWEGFAGYNALVYDHYLVLDDGIKLSVNTTVTVLWDGGDFLAVDIDGEIGYMDAEKVGTSRYSTGGGGGNSGSDWTPPAL